MTTLHGYMAWIDDARAVYMFTDEDLELFSQAHNVSANLLQVMRSKLPEDVKQSIISRCETSSQRYLEKSKL